MEKLWDDFIFKFELWDDFEKETWEMIKARRPYDLFSEFWKGIKKRPWAGKCMKEVVKLFMEIPMDFNKKLWKRRMKLSPEGFMKELLKLFKGIPWTKRNEEFWEDFFNEFWKRIKRMPWAEEFVDEMWYQINKMERRWYDFDKAILSKERLLSKGFEINNDIDRNTDIVIDDRTDIDRNNDIVIDDRTDIDRNTDIVIDDRTDIDRNNDIGIDDRTDIKKNTDIVIDDRTDIDKNNDIDRNNDIRNKNFSHLWVLCEICYQNNYKQFLKLKMNICEYCDSHLKMDSSDRIELSIDFGTWDPMDEDMVSMDPIAFDLAEEPYHSDSEEEPLYYYVYSIEKEEEEGPLYYVYSIEKEEGPSFYSDSEEKEESYSYPYYSDSKEEEELESYSYSSDSDSGEELYSYSFYSDSEEKEEEEEEEEEEQPYIDRIDSYQRETGLTEAVQTGIGQLKSIPTAIAVMDFKFIGGSMGSVVGEKMTRLIEHATYKSLPLMIACASGGARMQEGSLSLMQMAKISSASYTFQLDKKSFYISMLTSPTTGGVTASFGTLGNIIITEPNTLIAFAGKRVIEELLKTEVPEGSQESEYLFEKGLFDPMVPRNLLKGLLGELFLCHSCFSLNPSSKQKIKV